MRGPMTVLRDDLVLWFWNRHRWLVVTSLGLSALFIVSLVLDGYSPVIAEALAACLAVVFVGAWFLWGFLEWNRIRRLPRFERLCPNCEYRLRGLTGPNCPECGERIRTADAERDDRNV